MLATIIMRASDMAKKPKNWLAIAGGLLVALAPEIGELATWSDLHAPDHVSRILFSAGGVLTTFGLTKAGA